MKTVIWALLAAVLAGALGFYGGVTYQKAQTPSFAGRAGGPGGPGFGGGAGANRAGRFNPANITTGTVIAQDSSSITVKTSGGSSKTVFISAQTTVGKQVELTPADVKVGDQVAAFGQATNGGITAATIEVVPPGGSFRGFGGGFGRGGGPGAPSGNSSGQ